MDVYILVVKIPYNVHSLYVGLEVRASSVGVGANYRCLRLNDIDRFELVVGDRLCD